MINKINFLSGFSRSMLCPSRNSQEYEGPTNIFVNNNQTGYDYMGNNCFRNRLRSIASILSDFFRRSTQSQMEEREDLKSILPFLSLILRSSSLFWPPKALESLKALALGPDLSRVDSGEILFDVILDLRESIGLSNDLLAWKAADGYSLFFDDVRISL